MLSRLRRERMSPGRLLAAKVFAWSLTSLALAKRLASGYTGIMRVRLCFLFRGPGLWLGIVLPAVSGCVSRAEHIEVLKKNEALRVANQKLERTVAMRDQAIANLEEQIGTLQKFPQDRPLDIYSPVSMEIVSMTGGDDYDGRPGDDGVTVHVRLRDADGSSVKSPGRFTVQLLDNSDPRSPVVLGVCQFEDEAELRKAWYGRFGTQHFTFKCPFRDESTPPRHVNVNVEFTDFLTGKTLRETAVVDVSPASS